MDVENFMQELRDFIVERDWSQFHSPENLAKSISIESAELLECFQWGQSIDPEAVAMELADVLTYCLLLAQSLNIDWVEAMHKKLEITRQKYPVDLAFGTSKRYDELQN